MHLNLNQAALQMAYTSKAASLGFEPRTVGSEPTVLPVTPRSNNPVLGGELTGNPSSALDGIRTRIVRLDRPVF